MLVNNTVSGIVQNKLNRFFQFIRPFQTVFQCSHFCTAHHGISPHKDWNFGFNRIFAHWQTGKRNGIKTFTRTAVAAVDTDISGQTRQHRNCTGSLFTVGMALWPPTLADISRLSGGNFSRQTHNGILRNRGDF